MQSGGINPAITLIGGLALAFVLEKSPKLMALLSLFGLVETPQKGGTMMRGGFFGINLASATNAAKGLISNAQTKTIAVSKDRVINSLNALKAAFNDDPNVDPTTKTNIKNCVDQLVAKITPAPPSAPENVTSEDITTSVQNADDTTPAPEGETFDAMVKRVLNNKIDLLKTKYETAINARIESFKGKYNLGDDDMKCINILKDAVLSDLNNKKNDLFTGIMGNPNFKTQIDNARIAFDKAKNIKDNFLQNPQKFGSLFGTKKP